MVARIREIELQRMAGWLASGLALLVAAFYIGADTEATAQAQALLYRLGKINTCAWLGYWIDRRALGKIDHVGADPQRLRCRAIIIAAAVVSGGLL